MKGVVVSFVSEKRFGFINDEEGNNYFFHASGLVDSQKESSLLRGAHVEFEPTAAPKGLKAVRILVKDSTPTDVIVKDFFVDTRSHAKRGKVHFSHPFETRFFNDINEGKEQLKQDAIKLGYNAVINFKMNKVTFNEGNYKYSKFSFEGRFALVTERKSLIPSEAKVAKKVLLDAKVNTFLAYQPYVALEAKVRADQVEDNNSDSFGPAIFFTLLGLIIFMGIVFSG